MRNFSFFFNCKNKVKRNFIKNACALPTLSLQLKKAYVSHMFLQPSLEEIFSL
jgi:hypothetical protein